MQGYKDSSAIRENQRREEEMQMQREQTERQRKAYYEEQERRNIQAYETEQQNEEIRKREDLKMKLEALKHGYEITEDGKLKKIEKPKRKGASEPK